MCCVVKCRRMSYKRTSVHDAWRNSLIYSLRGYAVQVCVRGIFSLSFRFFVEFMSQWGYFCLICPISMYTLRVTAAEMTIHCVRWWFTLKERLKPCAGFIHILTTMHDSCEHDLHIYRTTVKHNQALVWFEKQEKKLAHKICPSL